MSDPLIVHAASEEAFALEGCAMLTLAIEAAIRQRGTCILGLSGGATPRAIYTLLGEARGIDWSRVWVFLVDDRYIPRDDPRSNQFLLRSTLLKEAPIPESQTVLPDTTLPYDTCVRLYGEHLESLLRAHPADIVTLGMGDDGHIASLFPPLHPVIFDTEKRVIATQTDRFDVRERISVTLPVLVESTRRMFFLRGNEKIRIWETIMRDTQNLHRWPAQALVDARTTVLMYST